MALTPLGPGWPFARHSHRESIFDAIDASWNRFFLFDDSFRLPFFFDDLFPFPSPFCTSSSSSSALVDWRETADLHVFKADLPGVKKDEIKVEVEDSRVLRISGQHSLERDETSDTWHRSERSSGSFLRRFTLPENALMDRTRATMENGVLTVTVPKKREVAKNPEINSIDVSG